MKKVHFKDITELAEDILDKFLSATEEDEDYGSIAIVGGFADIRDLTKYFIKSGFDLNSIDLHDPEWVDYCDEYVLEIDSSGICVEKAVRKSKDFTIGGTNTKPFHIDGGYFYVEATYVYILTPTGFDMSKARKIDDEDPNSEIYVVEIGEVVTDKCHCCDGCKNNGNEPIKVTIGSGDDKTISLTIDGGESLSDDQKTTFTDSIRFLYDIFHEPWYMNF